jgi:hypothetical protein
VQKNPCRGSPCRTRGTVLKPDFWLRPWLHNGPNPKDNHCNFDQSHCWIVRPLVVLVLTDLRRYGVVSVCLRVTKILIGSCKARTLFLDDDSDQFDWWWWYRERKRLFLGTFFWSIILIIFVDRYRLKIGNDNGTEWQNNTLNLAIFDCKVWISFFGIWVDLIHLTCGDQKWSNCNTVTPNLDCLTYNYSDVTSPKIRTVKKNGLECVETSNWSIKKYFKVLKIKFVEFAVWIWFWAACFLLLTLGWIKHGGTG